MSLTRRSVLMGSFGLAVATAVPVRAQTPEASPVATLDGRVTVDWIACYPDAYVSTQIHIAGQITNRSSQPVTRPATILTLYAADGSAIASVPLMAETSLLPTGIPIALRGLVANVDISDIARTEIATCPSDAVLEPVPDGLIVDQSEWTYSAGGPDWRGTATLVNTGSTTIPAKSGGLYLGIITSDGEAVIATSIALPTDIAPGDSVHVDAAISVRSNDIAPRFRDLPGAGFGQIVLPTSGHLDVLTCDAD